METTCGEDKEANGRENGDKDVVVVSLKSSEPEDQISEEEEEESESQCLLPPRKGGMSRSTDKIKRTVQWNDIKGDNLAEVLVYEPSEVSDTDDDDSDSCICTIM
ncbi:BnaC04g11100D [Brassica napus]|uniref:Uncharacterized protein n=3 Tax=Brassica TaxID=3705 RepID=A0A0D3BSF7_BRAOL|nr:PREDICTED: uncharacterized protein LOC106337237 isoform X2 [Brassica oleracea var. oleracea]XP_013748475.1 uncharacterized protein BNAC04G11100D isoform X2 [Brassica napus]CAF1820796.1 unnamed protein product [Brassica napus]CDY19489.1 BnaC04g11100D [Brassica napus]VDD06696.1 unnamed protein product [Brassica oleracea]